MPDMQVWKFVLPEPDVGGRVFADLPEGAEPFSVGVQGNDVVVWARCYPALEGGSLATVPRRFIMALTGQPIPDFPEGVRFLGTVVAPFGIVIHVWVHVWERDPAVTALMQPGGDAE